MSKILRNVLLCVIIVVSGLGSVGCDDQDQRSFPLEGDRQTGLKVKMCINGIHKTTLILDTGASYTVISHAMAREAGIGVEDSIGSISIQTANGVVRAPVVKISQLGSGDYHVKDMRVAVHDIDPSGDYDGLLGLDFFGESDITITQGKVFITK